MTKKKPYSQPQLFRIQLNQEQAILSACSLTTTAVANGGGTACRSPGQGGCKNHSNANGDSGPRPS